MNIIKTVSESRSGKQTRADRRSFIRKTGAAVAAVFASAVAGVSKTRADETDLKGEVERLSKQLGILEDANAIRNLHQVYESHLDRGMYEEVVKLFADEAEVFFNGGIFAGKKGVQRLYLDHFSRGLTGRKIEPPPDLQLQEQENIEVAQDRTSARARFPYSMQVGMPMVSDSVLVQMARLQGQGIIKWWEGGIYEVSYVKEGDAWKIKKLDFRTMGQADHALGWAYSKPISIPLFSKAYPENPTGPDKLIELRKT
jgi:carotenoid cleavage dioxygenase